MTDDYGKDLYEEDLFDTGPSEEDIAKAKEAEARDARRLETLRKLMNTREGREYIFDNLSGCHVFALSFSTESLMMAFKEGERNIGIRLLSDVMRANPDQYINMMRENNA